MVAAVHPEGGDSTTTPCMDGDDDVCCICLEALRRKGQQRNESLLVTECGHTFHFKCILSNCRQRKQQQPACPLCRHTLELGPMLLAISDGCPSSTAQQGPPHIVVGEDAAARPRIQQWRYIFATGVIKGVVSSYPGHQDGAPISTSRIASAEGESTCITQSGSRYELGSPDVAWQQEMERRGLWDETNPLGQLSRWKREREVAGSTISAEIDRESESDDE